jgi:hypothetical protein
MTTVLVPSRRDVAQPVAALVYAFEGEVLDHLVSDLNSAGCQTPTLPQRPLCYASNMTGNVNASNMTGKIGLRMKSGSRTHDNRKARQPKSLQ